jgi:hypothetical protein
MSKRKSRDENVEYDPNVNYDVLEQHQYADSKGYTFYTCPICSGEYLAAFITEENGQTMCIDCWNKKYGNEVCRKEDDSNDP